MLRIILLLIGIYVIGTLAGCSRRPKRVEVPDMSPSGIASAAMTTYDANGDGSLDAQELLQVPALIDSTEVAMKFVDQNGDGAVSADEIEGRVQHWIDSRVGLQSFQVHVTQGGRPLVGAEVKLVPEPFMGGTIEEAIGTADDRGMAVMSIPEAQLPSNMARLRGVRSGFYKVEITHPSTAVPAQYNTATTLGVEVAQDIERMGGLIIDL